MHVKPLGMKNYGSIGHLPNSRMGSGDHSCDEGQYRICCEKVRDRHDEVFVEEKLDGSNVGVAKLKGEIIPLMRAGYRATDSFRLQHKVFHKWVMIKDNFERFHETLREGERIAGEWLMQAHGTMYDLPHEPFVAFDLMIGSHRATRDEFYKRLNGLFIVPTLIHRGGSLSVEDALSKLGDKGQHGAIDPIEGVVYRVERKITKSGERTPFVNFLAKYVRPEKKDGIYLSDEGGVEQIVVNFQHGKKLVDLNGDWL